MPLHDAAAEPEPAVPAGSHVVHDLVFVGVLKGHKVVDSSLGEASPDA